MGGLWRDLEESDGPLSYLSVALETTGRAETYFHEMDFPKTDLSKKPDFQKIMSNLTDHPSG